MVNAAKQHTLTKKLFFPVFVLAGAIWFSCMTKGDPELGIKKIETAFAGGNFNAVERLADSLKSIQGCDTLLAARIDSLQDLAMRIRLDFSLSEKEISERLTTVIGDFSEEEKAEWERSNQLEWRMIDGEMRYFNRAATNLKRILAYETRMREREKREIPDDFDLFKIKHAQSVVESAGGTFTLEEPVSLHLKYTLTVKADAVPAGETIRCWMPWPREIHPRQQEVRLIRTMPDKHVIAPDTVQQRSLYLEKPAVAGEPTVFGVEFIYRSMAQYADPASLPTGPPTTTPHGEEFTSEQRPHILFTEKIVKLSESIVGDESDQLKIVRRIFNWIDTNIPWAGAPEYGTIPNIPEYVIDNRRGDCGMKTLLFMTLARYNRIPVKWQSGWMLHPGEVNLHDWCEVWYDGVGWVPLDMSFGRLPSREDRIRDFYMTGIDAYRLIVNDNIGKQFFPAKKYPRSEPNDFQRGEVEWRGGNLYFDKWNYHMEVNYQPSAYNVIE